MPEYITQDIEISSNESDQESCDEKNSDEENFLYFLFLKWLILNILQKYYYC